MQFSVFFFGTDRPTESRQQYETLLESARFADEHGFTAIWTPERHFAAFGGLYPSPSITSAALSMITHNIQLRAGSIVQPLQNAIRVAEEWAMIDNLSGGRVGIAFASGWHPDDFVLSPDKFANRRCTMYEDIKTIRKLWAGDTVTARNGIGREVRVRTLPRPIQRELPVWITAQSDDSFVNAGTFGVKLLTNFNHKTTHHLAAKAALYRAASDAAGYGHGHLTLVTHALVLNEVGRAKVMAAEVLRRYLAASMDLQERADESIAGRSMTEAAREVVLERAVKRIIEEAGLIGTPTECLERVNLWRKCGVDEVACLVDFGVPTDVVLTGLQGVADLGSRVNAHNH